MFVWTSIAAFAKDLTPDEALGLASIGVCLGFVECNRPGRVVPGATGLALFLLGCGTLLARGLRSAAASILVLFCVVFVLNLRVKVPFWMLFTAIIGLVFCLRFLMAPGAPGGVGWPVAVLCGATVGSLSAVLTRVAYRARRAKAVN